MYKTQEQAREFVQEFAQLRNEERNSSVWSGIAVPFTLIDVAHEESKKRKCALHVGAQNMHSADHGAFTGEVALEMLTDRGAEFVILGHSERRVLFGETDTSICKKVHRAFESGFRAIVCIGETDDEYREGKTHEVLERQLASALDGTKEGHHEHLMVAYEPIWAIGTGKMADLPHVEGAHLFCREWLLRKYPESKVPLLYGGSVTSRNAREIRDVSSIDGVLAGSASLSPQEFDALIQAFAAQ